jgi:hypothetical protein
LNIAPNAEDNIIRSHPNACCGSLSDKVVLLLRMEWEVGRWGESGGAAAAAERLTGVGASHVVFTLAEARERVLKLSLPQPEPVLPGPGPR